MRILLPLLLLCDFRPPLLLLPHTVESPTAPSAFYLLLLLLTSTTTVTIPTATTTAHALSSSSVTPKRGGGIRSGGISGPIVQISPVSYDENAPDSRERPLFHDDSAVSFLGNPYTGPYCGCVGEGYDRTVRFGFAVFESEDAMFRCAADSVGNSNSAGGVETDPATEEEEEEGYYFGAEWLKKARPSEYSWAKPEHILNGDCAPFAAFARRLHTGVTMYRSSAAAGPVPASSSPARHDREEYVGAVTVSGPITRGVSSGNNVYSLHQDPCFFTSLLVRRQKLAAADGGGSGDGNGDEPVLETPHLDDDDPEAVVSLPEKVLRCYQKSTETHPNNSDDDVTIRQINYWLPHLPDGEKYLVFLSRYASSAIASLGPSMWVQNSNGNRWLTERGLEHVQVSMPEHVFVTNRPTMFVSANAKDEMDALFHCGAVVVADGGGDEDNGSGGADGKSRSTEIRVAVCSRRVKR